MDQKFEAVIDLEAQPLTDAVRVAIAGLQALAAELDKANSSLDQAAGGMDKSAASAEAMAGASTGAAGALDEEGKAAKMAAEAHEKHADALKKGADATRRSAEENKRMREGLMVTASGLRMASSVAGASGHDNVSRGLDLAGSMVNAVAMKAMMGPAGAWIGGMEAGAKGITWLVDAHKKGVDKMTAYQREMKQNEFIAVDADKQIQSAKNYADALRIQIALENEILNVERQIALNGMGPASEESERAVKILADKANALTVARNAASVKAAGLIGSDNATMLDAFNAIRTQALGEKGFQLDLINASSETEKLGIIQKRIEQMRAEGEAKFNSAYAARDSMKPADVQKLLDDAANLMSAADSLEIQAVDGNKGRGRDLPAMAGPDVQVDAFWARGLFMGGGAGNVTNDYNRRIATAAERTAKNTEQMLSMTGVSTTTWEG